MPFLISLFLGLQGSTLFMEVNSNHVLSSKAKLDAVIVPPSSTKDLRCNFSRDPKTWKGQANQNLTPSMTGAKMLGGSYLTSCPQCHRVKLLLKQHFSTCWKQCRPHPLPLCSVQASQALSILSEVEIFGEYEVLGGLVIGLLAFVQAFGPDTDRLKY